MLARISLALVFLLSWGCIGPKRILLPEGWTPKDDRKRGGLFPILLLALVACLNISCATTPGPFGKRTALGADTKGYLAAKGGSGGNTTIVTTTAAGESRRVELSPGAEVVVVDSEATSPGLKSVVTGVTTLGASAIAGHFFVAGSKVLDAGLTARAGQIEHTAQLKNAGAVTLGTAKINAGVEQTAIKAATQ